MIFSNNLLFVFSIIFLLIVLTNNTMQETFINLFVTISIAINNYNKSIFIILMYFPVCQLVLYNSEIHNVIIGFLQIYKYFLVHLCPKRVL